TEPLPESLAQREGQEVEVSFSSDFEEDQALIAALEEIRQEIEALGNPADDTPEERSLRVELVMKGLRMGPPMSPEVEASLIESSRRPNRLVLATANSSHFGRIPDLELADWRLPAQLR
ncbi:MAG: hypothetical protein R2856_40215, partial [Caldilineaceae bacterium]